jgi:hypothetical protein
MTTDIWDIVAKRAAEGERTPFTKREFYEVIATRAQAARRDHETSESAFARYVTEDKAGRVLFKAYRLALGPDFTVDVQKSEPAPAPSTRSLDRLNALAAELRKTNPSLTEGQSFTQVYLDPANRELTLAYKTERVSAARG